jgi:hypothetical protein
MFTHPADGHRSRAAQSSGEMVTLMQRRRTAGRCHCRSEASRCGAQARDHAPYRALRSFAGSENGEFDAGGSGAPDQRAVAHQGAAAKNSLLFSELA